MTLHKRLLSGLLVLLALFVAGATTTVLLQRNHLYGQIDNQLLTAPPPNQARGSQLGREDPISALYMARIETDQTLTVLVRGQRLTEDPFTNDFLADLPGEQTLTTVPGDAGASEFRLLYSPEVDGRPAVLVALPLDEVDATVRQLIYTSAVIAALMAGVAAILASWVNRLGLKPISEMTAVADTIAAGDTSIRVTPYDAATEAGRLGNALNLMLDERDRAESTLRSFVSNASHELRTPLTSIRGFLDLYEQGAFRDQDQLDDVVRRMQIESARMNLLVEDLLLLAKLDEQQPLDVTSVDLAVLLADVAASAKASHPDRTIAFNPSWTTAPLVAADPLRLQQVVASLVDNALTHTDADVTLSAESNANTMLIAVADAGPGLSPEAAAQLFDRFYRGDASRSRLAGGSGLGLSIAKAIVEAHDGTLTVQSGPGRGTAFTIQIPTHR